MSAYLRVIRTNTNYSGQRLDVVFLDTDEDVRKQKKELYQKDGKYWTTHSYFKLSEVAKSDGS